MSMTRYILHSIRRYIALLFCLWSLPSLLHAANSFGYTEEHPLVIAGDWDFRPFEFINIKGEPTGYNVDVLNLILDRLNIPHKFVMQEWHVATNMFKNHEADLTHALYLYFKDYPYASTHKYINYYNLKVARRADTPPLNRLKNLLPTDTLLVKKDDYAAIYINSKDSLPFVVQFHSPKEALTGINQGRYKYYVWGEIPLSHKVQELNLDSITLDEIDIPAGEMRIIGYDKDLINMIDDQYTRLEQAGELQKVYDHWFHPEREHGEASSVALFIIVGLLIAAISVFLLARLVRRRVAITVRQHSDLGEMMDRVLRMGDYFMVEWDIQGDMLRNKYGNLLPDSGMKPQEFLTRMLPEEAKQIHVLNEQLATGVISHFEMNLSFNQGTPEQPIWRVFYGNAIVEKEDGKSLYIIYTAKDITDETNESRRVKTIASKYKKMFDTNLVAMSFYDPRGRLLDLNKKMRELCQIDEKNEQYYHDSSLFNFPNLKGDYMPGSREVLYVCQHFYEPQIGLDKHIELRIHPAINNEDELVYYIVTCHDVTAERDMYLKQREHDRQLHATNEAIKRYELQLSYLLEESNMYIWNYRPAENIINLTRSPGRADFSQTIEEYLNTVNAEAREQAMGEIHNAIQQGKPYNVILPFDRTPLDNQPTWYAVSGIPIFNKEGQLTEYFGLSRNITSLMQAQEQLRVETARAKDSGRQKAAFLANMTHEIRTPLNSIVGFSDLLPMIDDADEKKDLIRIISNNCDMLLRLINDILEASNIESRPLAINSTDIDFAMAFDDICQTLEQRIQGTGVQFIKDNPYKTFLTHLDKGRMQQVITNFVTNAIKYTHQGHIRVGYKEEKRDGKEGLYIYSEDTGAGIPKEKQASVFDRFVKLNEFVQGTGLGLSICKTIAQRCGGAIGVDSEGDGKGSTFWIWIPCENKHS